MKKIKRYISNMWVSRMIRHATRALTRWAWIGDIVAPMVWRERAYEEQRQRLVKVNRHLHAALFDIASSGGFLAAQKARKAITTDPLTPEEQPDLVILP